MNISDVLVYAYSTLMHCCMIKLYQYGC